MAAVPRNYESQYIIQGPCDVWALWGGIPPSAANPTADANCLQLDVAGIPQITPATNAMFLGSLEGPAVITITEVVTEIHDDQHDYPIDAGFNTVEASLSFIMKELQTDFLMNLVQWPTGYAADLSAFSVGGFGTAGVYGYSLLFVSPKRIYTAGARFYYALFFKPILQNFLDISFARGKESTYKLEFKCLADTSRLPQDDLMQIVMQK